MKPEHLTDQIKALMTPDARKSLGKHGMTTDEAKAAFVAKSERDLQKQIASLLSVKGIWFCQSRMDKATTQRKGVPDFLLAWGYQPVAFEVKFGNGQLTKEQLSTQAQMCRNGWRFHVVRSLEDVKVILDTLEREHEESIRF